MFLLVIYYVAQRSTAHRAIYRALPDLQRSDLQAKPIYSNAIYSVAIYQLNLHLPIGAMNNISWDFVLPRIA